MNDFWILATIALACFLVTLAQAYTEQGEQLKEYKRYHDEAVIAFSGNDKKIAGLENEVASLKGLPLPHPVTTTTP